MKKRLVSFNRMMKGAIKINKRMSEEYPKESRPESNGSIIMKALYNMADSVEVCMSVAYSDFARVSRKPKRNKLVKRKYL